MFEIINKAGFQMMAFSISLPFIKDGKKEFEILNQSQFIIGNNQKLEGMGKYIEEATKTEFELARPQFWFFLKELVDFEKEISWDVAIYSKLSQSKTAQDVVDVLINNLIKEVEEGLDKQIEKPKSKKNLNKLNASLKILYEGLEVSKMLEINNKKYDENIKSIEEKINKLTKIGEHYEELKNFNLKNLKKKIKEEIMKSLELNYEYDFKEMEYLRYEMGDREDLGKWANAKNAKVKEFDSLITDFSEKDFQENKKKMGKIINTYNNLKEYSFIGLLHIVLNAYKVASYTRVNSATKTVESEFSNLIREEKKLKEKGLSKSEKLEYFGLTEEVDIKNKIKKGLEEGDSIAIQLNRMAQEVKELVDKIKVKVGLEKDNKNINQLTLKGSLEKIIIGEFSEDKDDIFILFKDNRFPDMPNALWGAIVNKNQVGEIPEGFDENFIKRMSEKGDIRCSNFYSFSHMLQELSDDFVQERFFKKKFIVKDEIKLDKSFVKLKSLSK